MKAVAILLLVCLVVIQAKTIEFSEDNLIPEGIEYSPQHYFLVGSIGTGQIYTVDLDGNVEQLSDTPELTSSLGIQVDEENNRIYVANNANPIPANNNEASLVSLRLSDGKFITKIDFSNLGPEAPKLLNDVTLPDSKGNIYVTESNNGIVFRANLELGSAGIFLRSADLEPVLSLAPGLGVGVNGIDIWYEEDTGAEYLILSGTTVSPVARSALFKVDLSVSTNPYLEPVILPPLPLPAFDGLVFDRTTGHLFGVANASTIIELATHNSWESAYIVNEYPLSNPGVTTAVIVDGSAFGLANSGFAPNGPYFIEQADTAPVEFDDEASAHVIPLVGILLLILMLM